MTLAPRRLRIVVGELGEDLVRSDETPLFAVRLLSERGAERGYLYAVIDRLSHLSQCTDDVFDVMRLARPAWKPSTQYVARVQQAFLPEPLQRSGLGVALYARAVQEAAREGLVLVADRCRFGETSAAAERVYSSARLAEVAHRVGFALAAKNPPS